LKKAIRYTKRATVKLDGVFANSVDVFDPETAASYLRGLRNAIELLADISLGEFVRDRPGVQRWRYASHWIYYRTLRSEIVVLDIRGTAQVPL
jgi:plasmid stabilization system protein ParE